MQEKDDKPLFARAAPLPRLAYRPPGATAGEQLPLALLEVESARETVALDLRTVPKEIEKRPMGERWAALSRGRALFAMLFKEERGMGVREQLDAVLG